MYCLLSHNLLQHKVGFIIHSSTFNRRFDSVLPNVVGISFSSSESIQSWSIDTIWGALIFVKFTFFTISAGKQLRSDDAMNKVTMMSKLMATSFILGHTAPSTSQYWKHAFVHFDNILNWKSFLVLSVLFLMTQLVYSTNNCSHHTECSNSQLWWLQRKRY